MQRMQLSLCILIFSHLQNLQVTCVMPLNGQYLLVGTNSHLCVYNMVDNRIQTSVAHLNVIAMAPYKKMPKGSLVCHILLSHLFTLKGTPYKNYEIQYHFLIFLSFFFFFCLRTDD